MLCTSCSSLMAVGSVSARDADSHVSHSMSIAASFVCGLGPGYLKSNSSGWFLPCSSCRFFCAW